MRISLGHDPSCVCCRLDYGMVWNHSVTTKPRACVPHVPHTPYTLILRFASPAGRVWGVATHAVDRGAGYGLLKMGNGVFRLPNNRINILLIQQPFFNFFTHQFGSLLKKGIIIIIPDTKFF